MLSIATVAELLEGTLGHIAKETSITSINEIYKSTNR